MIRSSSGLLRKARSYHTGVGLQPQDGGDGNMNVIKTFHDNRFNPPAIRAISRMHNVNIGGTGLVIYKTSSDTTESGVYVNKLFFKAFLLRQIQRMAHPLPILRSPLTSD